MARSHVRHESGATMRCGDVAGRANRRLGGLVVATDLVDEHGPILALSLPSAMHANLLEHAHRSLVPLRRGRPHEPTFGLLESPGDTRGERFGRVALPLIRL